jgi:hypothetical protein
MLVSLYTVKSIVLELLWAVLVIPLLVVVPIFLSLYDYIHLWAVYLIKGALSIGSLPISPYYRYFLLSAS